MRWFRPCATSKVTFAVLADNYQDFTSLANLLSREISSIEVLLVGCSKPSSH